MGFINISRHKKGSLRQEIKETNIQLQPPGLRYLEKAYKELKLISSKHGGINISSLVYSFLIRSVFPEQLRTLHLSHNFRKYDFLVCN